MFFITLLTGMLSIAPVWLSLGYRFAIAVARLS